MTFFLQSQKKTQWQKTGTPSPGIYDIAIKNNNKLGYAPFGSTQTLSRLKAKQQKKINNPQKLIFQQSKIDFNQIKKQLDKKNQTSANFKSNTQRFTNYKNQQVPGPGQYQHLKNKLKHSKSFSSIQYNKIVSIKPTIPSMPIDNLGFKQDDNKQMKKVLPQQIIQPYPGAYDIAPKHTSKGVLTWKQQTYINRQNKKQPGPGDYNVSIKQSKSLSSCFVSQTDRFGVKNKLKQKKSPGPGAYNIQKNNKLSHNASAQAFFNSKTSRFQRSRYQDNIGPGAYNHQLPKQKSMNLFKKYLRQDEPQSLKTINRQTIFNQTNNNPGPGQYRTNYGMSYQLHKNLLRKHNIDTLPKQKRKIFQQKQQNIIPGPGSYEAIAVQKKLKGKLWKPPKVVNLKQKLETQTTPSPMQYSNFQNTIEAKVKSMNSKLKFTEQKPFNVGQQRFKHYSQYKDNQKYEQIKQPTKSQSKMEQIQKINIPKKKRLVMTTIKVKVPFGVSSNKYEQKLNIYNGPDFYNKQKKWIKPSYNIRSKIQ